MKENAVIKYMYMAYKFEFGNMEAGRLTLFFVWSSIIKKLWLKIKISIFYESRSVSRPLDFDSFHKHCDRNMKKAYKNKMAWWNELYY